MSNDYKKTSSTIRLLRQYARNGARSSSLIDSTISLLRQYARNGARSSSLMVPDWP